MVFQSRIKKPLSQPSNRKSMVSEMDTSPAQNLFDWHIRTRIRKLENHVKPSRSGSEDTFKQLQRRITKRKEKLDIHFRPLQPIWDFEQMSMPMKVISNNEWIKGRVLRQIFNRSYEILTDYGVFWGHRFHIKMITVHDEYSSRITFHETNTMPLNQFYPIENRITKTETIKDDFIMESEANHNSRSGSNPLWIRNKLQQRSVSQ